MDERKLKIISRTGVWLTIIVAGIYGLVLTITGYLLDWGPGGSMEGPFWKIVLTGLISFLAGAFIGIILVKKLGNVMLVKQSHISEFTIRSFAVVLIGSLAAFVSSWFTGYFIGKITGTIEGLDWITVLVYTPLMSIIYGIPVSLIAAVLFGIFVFFYLKVGRKYRAKGKGLRAG